MGTEGRLVNSTDELKKIVKDYESQGYEIMPVEAEDRAIVVKRREASILVLIGFWALGLALAVLLFITVRGAFETQAQMEMMGVRSGPNVFLVPLVVAVVGWRLMTYLNSRISLLYRSGDESIVKKVGIFAGKDVVNPDGTLNANIASDLLINALLDENPDIRKTATAGLVSMDQAAVEPLLKASKQGGATLRNRAMRVLDRINWEPEQEKMEGTAAAEKNEMFCEACKIELVEEAQFCPECGLELG